MVETHAHTGQDSQAYSWFMPAGILTLAVVLLAFLAFDDITTDNATRFPLEYTALLGCSVWCLLVVVQLARTGHRVLGTISLLALGGAVWGQRAVGPGIVPSFQPEYVATLAGVGWFLALSIILVALGIRGSRAGRPSTA